MIPALLLASATPRVVTFPGPVRSIAAPDGSGARIFYREHLESDGSQNSPVFYDDGRGRTRRIETLNRGIDVGWSPDGRRAFVQNDYGSNAADCSVLTRRSGGVSRIDLFDIVQRTPGRPSGPARPADSHYYVMCQRWQTVGRLVGTVSGHTDSEPSHEFDHPFTYDARRRRITWRR